MKRTQILITVPDLTEEQIALIPGILNAAIGEFFTARNPAAEYVQRRYPHMTEEYRTAKVPQVESRIAVASAIWPCVVDAQITSDDHPLNFGKLAVPDGIIHGYMTGHADFCPACAAESTIDDKPLIGYDDGDEATEEVHSHNDPPELDSPCHCFDCGALISTRLTAEGVKEVREYCRTHDDAQARLYALEFMDDLNRYPETYA